MKLLEYWQKSPPTSELLSILTQCFTSWRPAGSDDDEHVEKVIHEMGGTSRDMSELPEWARISIDAWEKEQLEQMKVEGKPN